MLKPNRKVVDNIHRLLRNNAQEGAKSAQITVNSQHVAYSDDQLNNVTFDIDTSARHELDNVASAIKSYPVPGITHIHLIVDDGQWTDQPLHLDNVGTGDVGKAKTPNEQYLVHLHLTKHITRNTIINPDGTVSPHRLEVGLTAQVTTTRLPGAQVQHRYYSVTAEPTMMSFNPPDGHTLLEITTTAMELFCDHLDQLNAGPGFAWTNYAVPLRNMPEFAQRLPDPPEVCEPIPSVPKNHHQANVLTPANPVILDGPHAAYFCLAHAWMADPPIPSTLVAEEEPITDPFPKLVIQQVNVTELDGSTTILPAPTPIPPSGEITPQYDVTRIANVEDITLLVEMQQAGKLVQNFQVKSPIYADDDETSKLVLVCRDAGLSADDIAAISDLDAITRSEVGPLADMALRAHSGILSGTADAEQAKQKILDYAVRELARLDLDQHPTGEINAKFGNISITLAASEVPQPPV